MRAVEMTEVGGPDVLGWVERADPEPGEGEVVVEVAAAGLNFIDTYHRSGLYPVELPFVPGLEGAGQVVQVGPGVTETSVGDRVAWTTAPGSYAELVSVPANRLVPVPDGVDSDVAAAAMLQGLTAHYLTTDVFPLTEGQRCLIHAGAGGVGLLLIQMAKMRDAEVFTTVGTAEKAELARAAGADTVILYRDVDFGDEVERIAGSRPLQVVYDGVGKSVFRRSLDLLAPRGMMATFGNASGPVDPIIPLDLAPSLFLTRPSLFDYTSSHEELLKRSADLFGWIESGKLNIRIGGRMPMSQAAEAHRMLEGRLTTGKMLLVL